MKKRIFTAVLAILSITFTGLHLLKDFAVSTQADNEVESEFYVENTLKNVENASNDLHIRAKSAYLMEFGTGTQIYAQNENERLPIASMCKIMTLLLCFDAINEGNLDLEEMISVSENASAMGGSQVFLEANAEYPAKELIKSIVVCSANDSCVAMAERIAGNETLFVEKMNEKAQFLGANDTLFANCTGLPKEPQYSTAKDVAVMLKELLKHPQYYEFGKVWMDKFQHPQGRFTEITNTNKLVRFYDGCDGGKTGFTNQAGFCLAATAKRKDMRIISVVIGAENSKNRFEDVKGMFDYAFANYSLTPILKTDAPLEDKVCVDGGKEKSISVYPQRPAYAFTKRGEKASVTFENHIHTVKAPIAKGDIVGETVIFKDGLEVERVPLIAGNDVKKATFLDRLQDVGRDWTARK
jgi:D-alanyl-D-alanine carboxypeptidase (penicillin-binding protein 5/6)